MVAVTVAVISMAKGQVVVLLMKRVLLLRHLLHPLCQLRQVNQRARVGVGTGQA